MTERNAAPEREDPNEITKDSPSKRLRKVVNPLIRPAAGVKVCGITRVSDAVHAARHGADFLGYIMYAASPRHVDPGLARAIVQATRAEFPHVKHVAVFVNEEPDHVTACARGFDYIQLHGSESPVYVSGLRQRGHHIIKSMGFDGARAASPHGWADYAEADFMLCDSYDARAHGGTGRMFDHAAIPCGFPMSRTFVAGGLNPTNVAATVLALRPHAVDVSSGVEESPGRKSSALVEAFINAAKNP